MSLKKLPSSYSVSANSSYVDLLTKLSSGQLSDDLLSFKGTDELGVAIEKVIERASILKKDLEISNANNNTDRKKIIRENWIKTKYAAVFSRLQGVKNLTDLGAIVLEEISHSIDAQIGTFYIAEVDETRQRFNGKHYLSLCASFGVNSHNLKNELSFGEGIVGQCALDARKNVLKTQAGDQLVIETGLGPIKISCIATYPILDENEVCGVLEFASVKQFKEEHLLLLDHIATNIGVTIRSISRRMLSERLFQEIATKNNYLLSQKQALDSAAIVAETDVRGKITYVNDKFLEISKYSRDEIMGKDHRILNSGYHPKEFITNLWKTILCGDVWHGEIRNRAKDGSIYWVDTTIYPVFENGRIQKLISIRFDITDKKRVLEELQQTTEVASKAAKIKTEFLANMSHEIRTPMNAIIGMCEVLKETQLNIDQLRYVDVLNSAGSALLDIINNILDLSKIEAGKMTYENISFDIEDVVNDAAAIMGNSAHSKGLDFIVSIQANLNTRVKGDPSRLRQVLINLIGNAIKFCREGEVHLKVVSDPSNTSNILFSVIDTGIGISEDKFDKIFTSFSQANTSVTRDFGGTGLGLAISKRIVEGMNGRIGFTSQEHKGSEFFFSVPYEGLNTIEENTANLYQLRGRKILIVDHNKTNAEALSSILVASGANVDSTYTYEDFVKKINFSKINEEYYDTLFIDYYVPNIEEVMTKESVIRSLKVQPRLVFMLNAEDRCNNLHVNNSFTRATFVMKPLKRSDVINSVRAQTKQFPNGTSILVVDDEDDLRASFADCLRTLNLTVFEAKNGKEALEILNKKESIKAILSDLKMPGMDGIQFFDEFKKLKRDIPFMIISAFPDKARGLEKFKNEQVEMFDKPFDFNQLVNVIENQLLNKSYESKEKNLIDHLTKIKVLVVDDVEVNLDLIKLYLSNEHYLIETASSGVEAIEKFKSDKFDLILMDIQMPQMDGHEAIRQIRSMELMNHLHKTPIIALSAHALNEEMENSKLAGSDGYITKPVKKAVLLKEITNKLKTGLVA